MASTAIGRHVQFRHIAFLTDLESGSEVPLHYAAALAQWYGARLVLAHAYEPEPPLIVPPEPVPDWTGGPTPRQQAEEKGRSLVSGLQATEREMVEGVVLTVPNVANLLHDLEARHPDLLVVATHARHGLRKLLSGSVTEEVFRRSPWPVLVLPPAHLDEQHAPHFHRVLYATDLSQVSATALLYAAGIAEDHGAEFVALYVDSQSSSGFSFDRIIDLKKLEDWLHEHRHDLTGALQASEKIVRFGEPATEITAAARELEADLIVIGARGAGALSSFASHLIGGTAYGVACSASCPVMIVPYQA